MPTTAIGQTEPSRAGAASTRGLRRDRLRPGLARSDRRSAGVALRRRCALGRRPDRAARPPTSPAWFVDAAGPAGRHFPPRQRCQRRPPPPRDHERRRAVLRLRQRRLARRVPGGRRVAHRSGDRQDRAASPLPQSRQRHLRGRDGVVRHRPPRLRHGRVRGRRTTTTAGSISTSPAWVRTPSIATTAARRSPTSPRPPVWPAPRCSARAAPSATSIATATSICSSSTTWTRGWTTTSSAAMPPKQMRIYCHPLNFKPLRTCSTATTATAPSPTSAAESGIGAHRGNGLGVVFGDYDDDGWLDVFVANDTTPNFLFHNQGKGRFAEVALRAGVAVASDGGPRAGMGTDFGDVRRRRRPRPLRHQPRARNPHALPQPRQGTVQRGRPSRAAWPRQRCPMSASAPRWWTTTTTATWTSRS